MMRCPQCGEQVTNLLHVDPQVIFSLKSEGVSIAAEMCGACISEFQKPTKGGARILAEEKSKETQKLVMWRSRVNIIKSARGLMAGKRYADAAVQYEKYIKVLEIVFEIKKGENLTPKIFKDTARTQELTVLATAYWDLLRIYDTHSKYAEKQSHIGSQLAIFLPFTPIFPDIIKKAQEYIPKAKNPSLFKQFIRQASKEKPRCFLATSAFLSPQAIEVQTLRCWRDRVLKSSQCGRIFIVYYYRISPGLARIMDCCPLLKPPMRMMIRFFLIFLEY